MEHNTESIVRIVKSFNSIHGTRYKFSYGYLQDKIQETLNLAKERNFDEDRIIVIMGNCPSNDIYYCLQKLNIIIENESLSTKEPETKAEAEPEQKVTTSADNINSALDFMGKIVTDLLAQTKLTEIESTLIAKAQNSLEEFIAKTYGHIEKRTNLDLGNRKVELKGVTHNKFDTILKFVNANEPVFLSGPAGSGKNVICKQIAKALDIPFYFTNAVTQEYKLTGFTDAMGNFHETEFYKAFKNGGLFMLDEMDASIPEVLIILNAAIANRYFDFPAPIGYVEAHPNFRVIAAGNTTGNGADFSYVGRNQLDGASLDRFAMVKVDYDAQIEDQMAMGNKDLLNFCRKFRKATADKGITTIVSYRCISRMAKLDEAMETTDLLESCILKGLEIDSLNAIQNEMQGCGKYTEAFNKIRVRGLLQ